MRARSILKMPEHLYTASPHGYQQRPLQRSLHARAHACYALHARRFAHGLARPQLTVTHRELVARLQVLINVGASPLQVNKKLINY
jgi:hypothetical protein